MSIVRLYYTLVFPPTAGWLWMIENPIIQYENSWYSKGKWTVPEGLNNYYQRVNYVYIMMQWLAGKNGECNAPICRLPDRPPTSGGAAFTNQGVEKTTLGLVITTLGLVKTSPRVGGTKWPCDGRTAPSCKNLPYPKNTIRLIPFTGQGFCFSVACPSGNPSFSGKGRWKSVPLVPYFNDKVVLLRGKIY